MMICGIDEAGRGPVIGPMVMAGVLIEKKDEAKLKKLNIKDSKQVSAIRRELLYDKILEVVRSYEIIKIYPEEIDAALASATLNLNWLEAEKTAIIIRKLAPDIVYVDCPSTNTGSYCSYLRSKLQGLKTELVVEHKADVRYISSSAASILAKVQRDREIALLRKEYGDFGSGYCSDEKTMAFIRENHMLPIFRKTWSTWQQAKAAKEQKNLSDF